MKRLPGLEHYVCYIHVGNPTRTGTHRVLLNRHACRTAKA